MTPCFSVLTAETLQAHRRSVAHAPLAQEPTANAESTATDVSAPDATTDPTKLSPADEFRKGIKRDITVFKPLKEKKQWNQWHRSFQATARAQGLGNVLNPTYQPFTVEEQALFDLLQDYTFAVFTSCLHEAQAANLVRNYSGRLAGKNAGNAQKLYTELVELMSTGISARTQRTNIETKLIQSRLDRRWNRSINAFLVHFAHQVNDLRELRDTEDDTSYSDLWCMSTLDSALSTHEEMSSHVSSLATSRSALQAALGTQKLPKLTFADYLAQLTDHAIVLDNKTARQRNPQFVQPRNHSRNANSTKTNASPKNKQQSAQQPMMSPADPTDPNIRLVQRTVACPSTRTEEHQEGKTTRTPSTAQQ